MSRLEEASTKVAYLVAKGVPFESAVSEVASGLAWQIRASFADE